MKLGEGEELDLDSIDLSRDVVVPRAAHDRPRPQLADRPRQHAARPLPFDRIVEVAYAGSRETETRSICGGR